MFNADAIAQWHPVQLKSDRNLPCRLSESPKEFLAHVHYAGTETGLRVAYGVELTGEEDDRQYFEMVQTMQDISRPLLLPGAHVMEAFPFLRYLPSWSGIKRLAEDTKDEIAKTTNKLFAIATTDTETGVIRESMVTRILADSNIEDVHTSEVRDMCLYLTATSFIAGVDTTNATMEAYFLTMAMHPDIQTSAQAELDAVIGPDRLPEFSDLASLPSLKELSRRHCDGISSHRSAYHTSRKRMTSIMDITFLQEHWSIRTCGPCQEMQTSIPTQKHSTPNAICLRKADVQRLTQ
ncbi:cytochrome P450 [Dichomitus squalens LYAD-421 SS1]|uniref:Cytochrome P450 n=1 Tax=Dichomitus squalens (strain LYAD-421) TaxID=732165 RepID=R7ST32_DICSQ|nr:cytochrome P450 [Dichomitus squalens LYAD-421 SS1]EJF59379.1 cytochrome P450 [Dichomitus squalens LYAD-421 SS1]